MATRKKNNKESHGERTHSALKSLNTSSSELNASLLNPKITPPPRSQFSALFKTAGNRANINRDILIGPNKGDVKYAVSPAKNRPTPKAGDFGGTEVKSKDGKKTKIEWKTKEGKQQYEAALAEITAHNLSERTRVTADSKAKADLLTADTRSFNAAKGGKMSRAARGRNGVL